MSTAPTSAPGAERVLRVTDVARHFDCDPNLVYALISRGQLRSLRVGRLIRIPESALTEFIDNGGTPYAPEPQ